MPPEEEDKSLRDSIEEAFDKATEGEEKDDVVVEPAAIDEGSEEDAAGDEPAASTGEEVSGEESEEELKAAKFLPPEGEESGTESGDAEAGTEPAERVPVAWRGEAKAEWDKVPAPVRQEVLRREQEVNEVLRESSRSRQFEQAFHQTVAPFQQFIAADGGDPLQATRNLMQTAAVLRAGSPVQKAQTVAQIVQQFGIDIETLDSALAGQPMPGPNGGQPPPQYVSDPRLDQVTQFMQGLQTRAQENQQAFQASVRSEIEAFENDPANMFFKDVEQDIEVLMRVADERGQEMSLKQAYDQAIQMRPELRAVVERQKGNGKQTQTLTQKKRAAASIQARSPQVSAPKEPETLRGAIEQAWDLAESGGR